MICVYTYISIHIYTMFCERVRVYTCMIVDDKISVGYLPQSVSSFCLKHLLLSVFPAHVCIHACLVPIKARRGQGGGSLETGVAGGYEPPYWVLGIEPHWKSISFSPLLFCCFFLLNCSFSPPPFFLINRFYFNFCTIYFVHIPCHL